MYSANKIIRTNRRTPGGPKRHANSVPTIETFPNSIKADRGRSRSDWNEPLLVVAAALFWAVVLLIGALFSVATALGRGICDLRGNATSLKLCFASNIIL